jgi:penicillin amidase
VQEIIPSLKGLSLTGTAQTAREILLGWDDRMEPESSGAAVYSCFWQSLLEQAFKNKFPRSLWVPEAVLEDNSRQMNAISVMLKDPQHRLWDDPTTLEVRESKDDILKLTLEIGVKKSPGA